MTSMNMGRNQSSILNDIKREVKEGRDVTHILNIKVSNENDNSKERNIRLNISRVIHGKPITKRIMGIDVTLTWSHGAGSISEHYYCNSPYTDKYVVAHTRALFNEVIADPRMNNIFARDNPVGLEFLVTSPVVHRIADIHQFDDDEQEEPV